METASGFASSPEAWREVYKRHDWSLLSVTLPVQVENVKVRLDVTLQADDAHPCARAHWFTSDDDVPTAIKGARFYEVHWSYDDGARKGQPPRHTPNLVYTPQKANTNSLHFRQLHARCMRKEDPVALKAIASVSTPMLEWAVVLVAGFRLVATKQRSQQSSAQQQNGEGPGTSGCPPAGTAGAPAVSKPEACFFGYFLPYNPLIDKQKDRPLSETWLELRLKHVREERRAAAASTTSLVQAWREERQRANVKARTGLPAMETNVQLLSYKCTSHVHYGNCNLPYMHTALIKSVLPGRCFHYSMQPWKTNPTTKRLEPTMEHLQVGFLKECTCIPGNCGKLRARESLMRLRTKGVPYDLQIRGAGLDSTGNHLGVFARDVIPAGSYVCEYVGELLTAKEDLVQRRAVEKHQLHYCYNMCLPPHLESVATVPRYIDATHIGNVARFINHHCDDANVKSVNVCLGNVDEPYMPILIQTLRDIQPGEQLLLDYQAGLTPEQKDRVRKKKGSKGAIKCSCGAARCLGVLFPSQELLAAVPPGPAETKGTDTAVRQHGQSATHADNDADGSGDDNGGCSCDSSTSGGEDSMEEDEDEEISAEEEAGGHPRDAAATADSDASVSDPGDEQSDESPEAKARGRKRKRTSARRRPNGDDPFDPRTGNTPSSSNGGSGGGSHASTAAAWQPCKGGLGARLAARCSAGHNPGTRPLSDCIQPAGAAGGELAGPQAVCADTRMPQTGGSPLSPRSLYFQHRLLTVAKPRKVARMSAPPLTPPATAAPTALAAALPAVTTANVVVPDKPVGALATACPAPSGCTSSSGGRSLGCGHEDAEGPAATGSALGRGVDG